MRDKKTYIVMNIYIYLLCYFLKLFKDVLYIDRNKQTNKELIKKS